MNIVLWIIAGILAAMFLTAGVLKLTQPKEKLLASNMKWVEDFSGSTVKFIGTMELLAGLGLILPAALDIVPILTPLAATGLGIIMIGAIGTHARRKEPQNVAVNVVLLALAAVVAIFRFGPNSF